MAARITISCRRACTAGSALCHNRTHALPQHPYCRLNPSLAALHNDLSAVVTLRPALCPLGTPPAPGPLPSTNASYRTRVSNQCARVWNATIAAGSNPARVMMRAPIASASCSWYLMEGRGHSGKCGEGVKAGEGCAGAESAWQGGGPGLRVGQLYGSVQSREAKQSITTVCVVRLEGVKAWRGMCGWRERGTAAGLGCGQANHSSRGQAVHHGGVCSTVAHQRRAFITMRTPMSGAGSEQGAQAAGGACSGAGGTHRPHSSPMPSGCRPYAERSRNALVGWQPTGMPVRLGNCPCTQQAPGSPPRRSDEAAGPQREVHCEPHQDSRPGRHGPERQPPSRRSNDQRPVSLRERKKNVMLSACVHGSMEAGGGYYVVRRATCCAIRTSRRPAGFLALFRSGGTRQLGHARNAQVRPASCLFLNRCIHPVHWHIRYANTVSSGWSSKLRAPRLQRAVNKLASAAWG